VSNVDSSGDMVFSTGHYFEPGKRLQDGSDINVIVDRVNGNFPLGSVSMKQMRQALVNVSSAVLYSVANVIPADIADPINIEWTGGGLVIPGDPLAMLIQTTLGYSNSQMNALFAAARTLPP
jgi:hypothetical protein